MNRLWRILFIGVIFIGLILRIYYLINYNLIADEIAYLSIARSKTLYDIFTLNHWIKDHGVLYYLFLKLGFFISKDFFYLRFWNLAFYLGSSWVLFAFFKKHFSNELCFLISSLFALFPYFVWMNVVISPFNLAIFFYILFFSYSLNLLLETKFTVKPSDRFFLPLFLVFGIYSDNSFIYVFIFITSLFLTFIYQGWSKRIFSYLKLLSLSLILLLPYAVLILNNFETIETLFSVYKFSLNNPVSFLNKLSLIVLRTDVLGKFIGLIFIFSLINIWFLAKKNHKNKILYLISTLNCLFSIIFIYLFSKYVFSIFIERSFWFLYINFSISATLLITVLWKKEKLMAIVTLISVLYITLIRYLYPGHQISNQYNYIPGKVPYLNVNYRKLINDIKAESFDSIVIVDSGYYSYVLKKYYFNQSYWSRYDRIDYINNQIKIDFYENSDVLSNKNLRNNALIIYFSDGLYAKIDTNQEKNINTIKKIMFKKKHRPSAIYILNIDLINNIGEFKKIT